MVTIVGIKYLKEGMLKDWLEAVAPIVDASRLEEGNISYHIHVDNADENTVLFLEEWESPEYVRNIHCQTEHVIKLVPELEKFYARPGLEYWTHKEQ